MSVDENKNDSKLIDKKTLLTGLKVSIETYKLEIIPSIYQILLDMIVDLNVTVVQMREILNGAFVLINNDNQYYYKRWIELQKQQSQKSERAKITKCIFSSSHFSCLPQYRLNGGVLAHFTESTQSSEASDEKQAVSNSFDLLVGCTFLDSNNRNYRCRDNKIMVQAKAMTFFQFERHNLQTFGNMKKHFINDFIEHNQSKKKKNLGPFGVSSYTEKHNPLIITFSKEETT
jgi:hypothetical protein